MKGEGGRRKGERGNTEIKGTCRGMSLRKDEWSILAGPENEKTRNDKSVVGCHHPTLNVEL